MWILESKSRLPHTQESISPIVAVPKVETLMEEIKPDPGICYIVRDLVGVFFSVPIRKEDQGKFTAG